MKAPPASACTSLRRAASNASSCAMLRILSAMSSPRVPAMPMPFRILALGLAGSLYCAAHAATVLDLQLSTGHDSAVNQSSWEPKSGQVQGLELTLSRSAVID